jgi:ElaB/YqjD/DUF883 family membrane-anchored ribosome-binding protein
MSAEQRTPEEIREEIEEDREELGQTVEALAGKADVKGQAKAKVQDVKHGAQAKMSAAKETAQQRADEVASKAKSATPESMGEGAQTIAKRAQANPVPVAVAAAFGTGVVVGWLLSR